MRVAVVGHVEWVEFLRVERVPGAGAIVHASSLREVAAGGGGVAAVQLARWCGDCGFFTAVGADELGRRTEAELRRRGVTVHAAVRGTQRRAITLVDADRERTIIVIGERLVAHGGDPLAWDELARCDGVYITGGDAAAVRAARRARVVVATSRILPLLRDAAIQLDALVGSANDPAERYDDDLVPPPRLVVRTDGARGGTWHEPGGAPRAFAPAPATVAGDTYGAGDSFAAALTLALAEGKSPAEATAAAADAAAEVLAYVGPYPPDS